MIQSYLNFKHQVVDSSYYKSTYGYIPITVQISVGNSVSKKYVLQISYYATQSIRPAESTEVKEKKQYSYHRFDSGSLLPVEWTRRPQRMLYTSGLYLINELRFRFHGEFEGFRDSNVLQ